MSCDFYTYVTVICWSLDFMVRGHNRLRFPWLWSTFPAFWEVRGEQWVAVIPEARNGLHLISTLKMKSLNLHCFLPLSEKPSHPRLWEDCFLLCLLQPPFPTIFCLNKGLVSFFIIYLWNPPRNQCLRPKREKLKSYSFSLYMQKEKRLKEVFTGEFYARNYLHFLKSKGNKNIFLIFRLIG